jgi:hypothetical protein
MTSELISTSPVLNQAKHLTLSYCNYRIFLLAHMMQLNPSMKYLNKCFLIILLVLAYSPPGVSKDDDTQDLIKVLESFSAKWDSNEPECDEPESTSLEMPVAASESSEFNDLKFKPYSQNKGNSNKSGSSEEITKVAV